MKVLIEVAGGEILGVPTDAGEPLELLVLDHDFDQPSLSTYTAESCDDVKQRAEWIAHEAYESTVVGTTADPAWSPEEWEEMGVKEMGWKTGKV